LHWSSIVFKNSKAKVDLSAIFYTNFVSKTLNTKLISQWNNTTAFSAYQCCIIHT